MTLRELMLACTIIGRTLSLSSSTCEQANDVGSIIEKLAVDHMERKQDDGQIRRRPSEKARMTVNCGGYEAGFNRPRGFRNSEKKKT